MQKTTGTMIDELLDSLKISQLQFAESLNVTTGAITNLKKRHLGIKVINKIVDAYPQVSREWLMTGEGRIFREERPQVQVSYGSVVNMGNVPHPVSQSTVLEKGLSANKPSHDEDVIIKIYLERIKMVDELRGELREELEEIKSIKEEMKAQREENAKLNASLHDAIFALRTAAKPAETMPLMAADGDF